MSPPQQKDVKASEDNIIGLLENLDYEDRPTSFARVDVIPQKEAEEKQLSTDQMLEVYLDSIKE